MILVDVYIPSVDETYDFMLEEEIEADKIILEILSMIAKKTGGERIEETDEFELYHMTGGKRLEKLRTLSESGVKDGSHLMIV